jgi:hypothetical protein
MVLPSNLEIVIVKNGAKIFQTFLVDFIAMDSPVTVMIVVLHADQFAILVQRVIIGCVMVLAVELGDQVQLQPLLQFLL